MVSKPADMGGNRIDQLGAAAGGIIIALHALLQEMPRLRELPQWTYLRLPALLESPSSFKALAQSVRMPPRCRPAFARRKGHWDQRCSGLSL